MNVPSILGAVSRDTVIYFVVISSSHLLIMYAAERVGPFTSVRVKHVLTVRSVLVDVDGCINCVSPQYMGTEQLNQTVCILEGRETRQRSDC